MNILTRQTADVGYRLAQQTQLMTNIKNILKNDCIFMHNNRYLRKGNHL